MFIVTLTFFAWALKSLTIFLITSPSPPVKPFQKASSTAGPVYSTPPEPVSGFPGCPAGGAPAPPPCPGLPRLPGGRAAATAGCQGQPGGGGAGQGHERAPGEGAWGRRRH